MTTPPIVLPRLMTPKVMRLSFAWAILTVNLMGVGIALISSVWRVMGAFQTPLLGWAYVLYLFFAAPYSLARVASTFLKSTLARESRAASLGLMASIIGVLSWLVILARDLNNVWDP